MMRVEEVYATMHALSQDPRYSDIIERLGGMNSRDYITSCNQLARDMDSVDELIRFIEKTMYGKKGGRKNGKMRVLRIGDA